MTFGAADDDLADLARRQQLPAVVHDRDLGPGGEPDRAGLARRGRQRVARHLVRGLGHAVGLDHRAPKTASSSAITCGGSEDDDERMKRSGPAR